MSILKMSETFKPEFNNPFHWDYLANVCGAGTCIAFQGMFEDKYNDCDREAWLLGWKTAQETGFQKYIVINDLLREDNKERAKELIGNTSFWWDHDGKTRWQVITENGFW